MHHVGNDIVDMDAPGAKNKNARFAAKILAPEEASDVRQSASPDSMLWAFWAAKETAFKVISKSHPEADFSPLAYHTAFSRSNENPREGMVETPHGRVTVKVFLFHTHVHCIGTDGLHNDLDHVLWGCQAMNSPVCESIAVRKIAIDHMARSASMNIRGMEIRNNISNYGTGPPILYLNGEKAPIDISLSHDGRFVAYAFVSSKVTGKTVSPEQI